jgi:hypothetical protein
VAGESAEREQAVASVIGGLTYALLRVFQMAAAVVAAAPTLALAERQAAFAIEEFERFRILRRRLNALTRDPDGAMARYRPALDAFYATSPTSDWLDAQVFHFVGDAITDDFAEMLAPHLDERTSRAVRDALTGRAVHEAFAIEQIDWAIATEGAPTEERVKSVAGKIVGDALSRLRETLLDSDALVVVLGGEDAVKDLVLELLGRHRERLERLGVERVD